MGDQVLQHRASLYKQSGFARLCGGVCTPHSITQPTMSLADKHEFSWPQALPGNGNALAFTLPKRIAPSMPWLALHGMDAVMEVAGDCKRRTVSLGLTQQMHRKEMLAWTALQKRYCRRR